MSAGKHHGVRFSAAGAAPLGHLATIAAADYQTNRIRIEYVAPKNAQHQPIYDTLKQNQALEQVQKIFSAFQPANNAPSNARTSTGSCLTPSIC